MKIKKVESKKEKIIKSKNVYLGTVGELEREFNGNTPRVYVNYVDSDVPCIKVTEDVYYDPLEQIFMKEIDLLQEDKSKLECGKYICSPTFFTKLGITFTFKENQFGNYEFAGYENYNTRLRKK